MEDITKYLKKSMTCLLLTNLIVTSLAFKQNPLFYAVV